MTSSSYKETLEEILALLRSGATSEAHEKIMALRRAALEALGQVPGPAVSLDGRTILELATSCIASPGDMHVLAVHVFADEEEEHDEDLLDQLSREFKEKLARYITFLETEFGPARVIDLESDAVDDDAADEALNLIEGGLYVAIWTLENATLYAAIVQADREAPLAIVLGAQ